LRIFVAKLCASVANIWKSVADGGMIVSINEIVDAKLHAGDSNANAVVVGRN
jgi:hypothetical protein